MKSITSVTSLSLNLWVGIEPIPLVIVWIQYESDICAALESAFKLGPTLPDKSVPWHAEHLEVYISSPDESSTTSADVHEIKNMKKRINIFFKVYSSSRPVLNSLVDLPKDLARPGKRLAPKSNNKIVKIIKSSGSPNLIP